MKKVSIITLLIVVLFISLFQGFVKYSDEILSDLASNDIMQFCQLVVNSTVYNYEDLYDDLLVVERGVDGRIELLDFDMALATKIAGQLVIDLEALFFSLEEGTYSSTGGLYDNRLQKINDHGGVISSVPIGTLTNNVFLSHIGPSLNIKYLTVSRVASEIVREVESYGVNHIMISLDVKLTVYMRARVPFKEEEFVKVIKYPLLLEIMQGDVPSWYQN